jgi:outer membrane protein assembly factor BamB
MRGTISYYQYLTYQRIIVLFLIPVFSYLFQITDNKMLRRKNAALTFGVFMISVGCVLAGDWPTFRHDSRRSGATDESIDAPRLTQAWLWQSSQPPAPAWYGPAKWDSYALIFGLRSMRNYDPVFHTTIADGRLYFGSSADDSVYCLNAKTGKPQWAFTTDGPVRIAPTVADGQVYFGSDDGRAYCLDAKSGEPTWKFSPSADASEDQTAVLTNGRPIPLWPCRTGVAVEDGRAYFATGMLPWNPHFFCSVDAKTGKPEGDGSFLHRIDSTTFEGAMVVGPQRIYVPRGRVAPMLFDRTEGKSLGELSGGGGCFALLTEDAQFFHGPGNRTGWITGSNEKKEKVATFGGGNVMVVSGAIAYLLTDGQLQAFDRKTKESLWVVPSDFPYELILAGNTLFAGGLDRVGAFDAKTGKQIWTAPVEGKAFGLAVAEGRLFVSTSRGRIYCFAPSEKTTDTGLVQKPAQKPKWAPLEEINDQSLLGRWVFQGEHAVGPVIKDLAGNRNGRHVGLPKFRRVGDYGALLLSAKGGDSVELGRVNRKKLDRMPREAITAECWARNDRTMPYCGLIGAVQCHGDDEQGWVLGFQSDRPMFALRAENGSGRLTYLKSPKPFSPGAWYYLVGTYDGKVMRLYVNGKQVASSEEQSGAIQYPEETFYTIGAFHDSKSNHQLRGGLHEVRVWGRALSDIEIAKHASSKTIEEQPIDGLNPFPIKADYETVSGPYLEFVGPDKAKVCWRTDQPLIGQVELLRQHRIGTPKQVVATFEEKKPTTDHTVTLSGLKPSRVYFYRLVSQKESGRIASDEYECDTFFNFQAARWPERSWPFEESQETFTQQAKSILDQFGTDRGVCMILGGKEGRLAFELARLSQMRVIIFDTDMGQVDKAREALLRAGVYGSRVAAYRTESLEKIPVVGQLANLLIATDKVPKTMARLVAEGGFALVPEAAELANAAQWQGFRKTQAKDWTIWQRPRTGGVWTHQYGLPNNAGFGGETLHDARTTDDLAVQWIGRPGPRAQADRNGRKPGPLAADNRLFVQGLHRIIAVDTNNGTPLWSLEIPDFHRFNIPRDCGNWCADNDYIYTANRSECWQIDAKNGQVVRRDAVRSGPHDEWNYDWGYLARMDDLILGSAVKRSSSRTNFYGNSGEGWYDSKTGPVTHPVCSDNLFALQAQTGKDQWHYSPKGVIMNPTITADKGQIWFVECRNSKVVNSDRRRIGDESIWSDQYLVSLDAKTGKPLWEKPLKTLPGKVVFFLAHGSDRLVLVASDTKYHVYALNSSNGEELWNLHFDWKRDNHGGHMSRPTIVGDQIVVRPRVISLSTGKFSKFDFPNGRCGSYVATANGSIIYRNENLSIWNPTNGKETDWVRLRPGCWISTIPACGALLSPEAGGGCSCGNWMETSIVFVPKEK